MSAVSELRRLYERDGYLSPEQVLAAAQDETSPLHGHFEWDDGEAGNAWRLHQARTLIMRCKVTVVGGDEQVIRVRQYVNVPGAEGERGHYIDTQQALADAPTRDLVIQQALRDVATLRRKYRALCDFDEVLRKALSPEPEAEAV